MTDSGFRKLTRRGVLKAEFAAGAVISWSVAHDPGDGRDHCVAPFEAAPRHGHHPRRSASTSFLMMENHSF